MYLPAINGEKKFVVDVDIPFEKPKNCDLTFNTEKKKPNEVSDQIISELNF